MNANVAAPPATASQSVAAPFRAEEHGWRLAAVTLACLISVFLDQATGSMVQAVDSYMVGSLGASSDEGLWLAIGYNTFYYASLISSPWAILKFGRRNLWVYGHITYAIASIVIAVAGNFWIVVGARMVQGLGQGTFWVCAVTTVLRVFPTPLNFIGFALFATISLAGPAVGPALGGWFSDINAWPALFIGLAVLAMVAASLVAAFLRDDPGARAQGTPVDQWGLLAVLLHLFTYHFITQEGERRDWLANSEIVGFFVAFCAFTILFVWRELRGTLYPFIKVRLFGEHNLRYGALLGFVLGVPLFGGNVFLLYLQNGIAFTPGLAGSELLLRIFLIVPTVPFVAYSLSRRLIDPRYFVIIGFLAVSISYWMLYFLTTPLSDFRTFIVPFVLQGFGFSLLFSPIASIVLTSIPPAAFADGVAIFKITLVTGGSFASTAIGVISDHRGAEHLSQIAGQVTLANPAVFALLHNGAASSINAVASLAEQQSAILAYADCNEYIAILVLLAAPAALILRPRR